MTKLKLKMDLPREILLVEIERWCAACGLKNRIGLTKNEAREFVGFKCEHCEHWNVDILREQDVPEWWEELKITGLYGLRSQEYESENLAADEFDDAEDLNKLLRRERRETQNEIGETASAQTHSSATDVALHETNASNDEARELERLREIISRRKGEEKLF